MKHTGHSVTESVEGGHRPWRGSGGGWLWHHLVKEIGVGRVAVLRQKLLELVQQVGRVLEQKGHMRVDLFKFGGKIDTYVRITSEKPFIQSRRQGYTNDIHPAALTSVIGFISFWYA